MNILDEISGAEPSPISLSEITAVELPPLAIPSSTVKNRAAVATMLSGNGSDVSGQYQAMVAEGESGGSTTVNQITDQYHRESGALDQRAIMSVLGDASLSVDQKRQALKVYKAGLLGSDSRIHLMTKGLEAGSDGETTENEDARVYTADMLNEMQAASVERQALINAHGAKLSDQMGTVAVDALETFLAPFGTSITSVKYARAKAKSDGRQFGIFDTVKAFLLAGNTKADMLKEMNTLSPQGQVEWTRNMLDIISKNSSIIAPTDNQFNQMMQAQDYLGQGGYSSTDKFLDNASFLLDIVGFGMLRKGNKVGKAAAATEAASETVAHSLGRSVDINHGVGPAGSPQGAPKVPSSGFEGVKVSAPMRGVNDAAIAAKQDEVASMLGDAGNLAERGVPSRLRGEIDALKKPNVDVKQLTKQLQKDERLSFKEATKQATKQADDAMAEYSAKVGRMEGMLETNNVAANASQRIDALEKEIAALQKGNIEVPAKLNPIADFISRLEMNSVSRVENPAAVANVLQQTNPARARAAHAAMVSDETGMIADAMYGTTRTQAIANDILPQIVTSSGSVTAKIVDIERDVRKGMNVSDEVRRLVMSSDVGIHMSQLELAQARAHVVNEFSKATDLYPVDSMGGFTTKIDGSQLEISSVYGTRDGAFVNAAEAQVQATHTLRHEGILPEDITILKRQGLDYVPTTLAEEAGKEGNYLIRVKMNRELTASDVLASEGGKTDTLTVKRNFFDRISSTMSKDSGSLSRWMFDAASMVDARITGAAVVGTDMTSKFEKGMYDLAAKFTDRFNKMEPARQEVVNKYIRDANFLGIAFDSNDLKLVRGFDDFEVDTLKAWRDFWDGHYYLENFDMVRTYNSQGYMKFENLVGDELHAKAMHKNNGLPANVYDSSQGVVVQMSRQEFDDLYNSGGTIAKLRRPSDFGGIVSEHVIVRNNASEYLRRFRDSDSILNYKEGYYQIDYKAPRFVDEITYKPNGDIDTQRAVAVGGSTSEVEAFATRMNRTATGGKEYVTRSNDRGMARGSDDWFDVNSANGRIAQKQRGKLLEDSDGISHLGDGSYLASPVDSAVRAARSISGRTVMRPVIEAAKARFLEQYGSVLTSDGMGGHKFPSGPADIGSKGKHDGSFVADARTTWEYIHYLENGYINSLDVFIKQGLNATATLLGERGFDKLERIALKGADLENGVTGIAKGSVFTAYIALNPLRNWIIQPNQIVRTFGYNPVGWMAGIGGGGIPKVIGEYFGALTGALPNPSTSSKAFSRLIDESGLLDSIDKQNLVRGSLSDAVTSTTGAQKWSRKAIEGSRKVGYDAGEAMNLIGHAAAVFDKRIRDGKGITSTLDMREMHSEIRAISYDMNFAGDMVYNQTSAAMLLQFLQVPHKAFLQATNRRIAPAVRAQMLATDLVMFGAPVALISSVAGGDVQTGNKTVDKLFMDGLEATLINNLWSDVTGEEQGVDYSALSPYGLDGWGKVISTLMSGGGVIPAFMNSPAGQVFFKDSGRVQSALYSMGRYFTPWRDEERTPEEALQVANEVLKVSSGWNNLLKSKIMFSTGKSLDQKGVLLDSSVTNHEAFMQAFGFTTQTVKKMYETQMAISQSTKQHADEVKQVFNSVKSYYQSQFQLGVTDVKQMQAVTGEILSIYKDDPVALGIISKSFQMDIVGKEPQLFMQILKSVELPTHHVTKDQIRNAPITDEQKEMLIKRIDDVANTRLETKKKDK